MEKYNGQTWHYERDGNGVWYAVCSGDFPGDPSGREKVEQNESILLEMGYQIGRISSASAR